MFSIPGTYFLRQGTFSFFLLGSVKARDEISEVVVVVVVFIFLVYHEF